MTPSSVPRSAVRYATAGVGTTPSLSTSTPELASPATTAASRNSPDALGSRPTTAAGRRPAERAAAKAPMPSSTSAAAAATFMASPAVRSRPATPRTPSVPNSRPTDTPPGLRYCRADLTSALRVLRRLAGLLQAVLLALLDPGIPGQEAGSLEGLPVFRVDERQCPGDPQPQCAGLAGDATASDPGHHVKLVFGSQRHERLADQLLVHLVGEVLIKRPVVDPPLPGSRQDTHARDDFLAAAGAHRVAGHHRLACRGPGWAARGRVTGLGGVLRHVLRRGLRGGGIGRRCGCLGVSGLSHGVFLALPRRLLLLRRGAARPGLLRDLPDLERGRLLRLVRMVGPRINLELAQHLPAQRVLREHAPDRLLDGPFRVPGQQVAVGNRAQPARVAGVPVRALVGELVAAERDLLGVDDDHEVPGVHVRREDRLVLAAQQDGRLAGQPAEYDLIGVDDMPLTLDIDSLRAECAHSHKPSRVGP